MQVNPAPASCARPRAPLILINFPRLHIGYLASIGQRQTNGEASMFFDNVVIAGVVTVGLMVAFFAGLGIFIWKDSNKRKPR
ncbi:hypothetical protein PPUJ20028_15110 [Pseudomonas putida]|nr:hypothetical protein PPUJ20028_15110 [Pseudomonas putida]GLO36040.1 hypothetical protein PPUN14671_28750 [Pseudomonas putida]